MAPERVIIGFKRKRNTPITTSVVLLLLLSSVVCLMSTQPISANSEDNTSSDATFEGWQVKNSGGYYSQSNGTIRIWSDTHLQGVTLFKEISPKGDFEFSLQVKAARMDGFGIFIGDKNCALNAGRGMNFEFNNKYGTYTFLLARAVKEVLWETGVYGTYWDWQGFAYGKENVWYTMKLTVQATPFRVTGQVFDENGVSLGSLGLSDMENFTFEDIECVGFKNAWGGDYYIRNISDVSSISKGTEQTQISINPEISSATLTSPVNIMGKLADSKGTALINETVVLWYTFAGINEWLPISSSVTSTSGDYCIQWANTASGDFTLKAELSGNSTHTGASNTTTLSVLPYQNQAVFFVESNSTVTALTFDSASSELGFSVTGPSGTSGYAQIVLAKNLIANGADIKVLLDGNQLNYSVIPIGDSWLVTIHYSHSTHKISVQLSASETSNTEPEVFPTAITVASVASAVFVLAGVFYHFKKHNH